MVVVLGFSATFFTRNLSEKRFVDIEKFNMQADFLAESGAHHALSELRERIETDLSSRVAQIASEETIASYYEDEDSLGFLEDFAYAVGGVQFSVEEGEDEATLTVTPLVLINEIDGDYDSRIAVTSAQVPENPGGGDTYIFYYNYATTGTGISSAISPNISKEVTLAGSFSVTVIPDSFANYALFTDTHTTSNNGLVWFASTTNFHGPVHTNDRLGFLGNPSGHFYSEVTQSEQTARFYNNRNYLLLDDDHNGTRDVPVFDSGFERGAGQIELEGSVSSVFMEQQATGPEGAPNPAGIYVPNEDGSLTGGIFIKGNVSNLNLAVVNGNPQYTIAQGSTTKIITVDYDGEGSTTVVEEGEDPVTYTGIPDGTRDEGTIIYSSGLIEGLSGVIDGDTVLSIASGNGDITISDHLRYENYNAGAIPNATGYTNMLGIVSWQGNVCIDTGTPDNIDIHGIIMAPEGEFKVDNHQSRPDQGTLTLLGGVIAEYYGAFGTVGWGGRTGYGRNFAYDDRALSGSIPPYFPMLNTFSSQDEGLYDRPAWRKG